MKSYTIDLTKIKGEGKFKCPKCSAWISPDDNSEDNFIILETIMKGEYLEKLTLRCNKCESQIKLTGFKLLNKPK